MTSEPTTRPCGRCGASIDPTTALMTGDGPVCKACENQQLAREAGTASWGSTFGPLGWGICSLFCNVMFIPSFLAITGGLRDLRALREEREAGLVDSSYGNRQSTAIFAIVLGSLHPLALVGLLGLAVLGGIIGALRQPSYDDYSYEDDYDYELDEYGYGGGSYGADPSYPSYEDDPSGGGLAADEGAEAQRGDRRLVHLDASRPFAEQMQEHLAQARALGLRPYLYATATWCPPCNALARYREDPRMVEAYAGTYIIEADIDLVSNDDLSAAGFRVAGIPAFYGVDDRGHHDGRMITGAAWGEDIPANMAPPLRGFFANDAN